MSTAAPIKAPLYLPNGRRTLNEKAAQRAWASALSPLLAIVGPLGYAASDFRYGGIRFRHPERAEFWLPAAVVVALADTLRPPTRRSKQRKI